MLRASRATGVVALVSAVFVLGCLAGCGGGAHGTGSGAPRDALKASAGHRRCPPSDRTFKPSPDPLAKRVLVPVGPTGVRVCRYWGEGDGMHRWTLSGQRLVTGGSALDRLVRRLDSLPPIQTVPARSCPVFGARSLLLLFQYSRTSDDPVRILRQGCVSVSNGRLPDRYGDGLGLGDHWPDEGLL
jgi:hypothetical protein